MKFTTTTVSFWVALAMVSYASISAVTAQTHSGEQRELKSKSKSMKKSKSQKQKRCRKNKGPVYTDVKGNGFFERRLISREIVETDEEHQSEETIMRIVMELCPGESQIKEGIDSGLGDYYRMAPTNRTIARYLQKENLQFNDSNYPTYSRAYSPVTILDNGFAEFLIKVERPGLTRPPQKCPFKDGRRECKYITPDADENPSNIGTTGLTYMLLTSKIGTTFLMTNKPENGFWEDRQEGYYAHNLNIVDDPKSEKFEGPYILNFIGAGIAITEINVLILSELLRTGVIEKINFLWTNRFYNLASWVYDPSVPGGDLATTFSRQLGKYGSQVDLGLVFSREERIESPYPKGRFNQATIEDFFNVTKKECGTQSKKIKWLVVGDSGFKKGIYPLLDCDTGGLGFDLVNETDDKFGINKVGTNAFYTFLKRDDDPANRNPSPVYKKYCDGKGLCKNSLEL